MQTFTIEPCPSAKAFEIFLKHKRIDLSKAEKTLGKIGKTGATSAVVLLGMVDGKPVSIYASGRIMIKETTRQESEKISKKLMAALEKGECIS